MRARPLIFQSGTWLCARCKYTTGKRETFQIYGRTWHSWQRNKIVNFPVPFAALASFLRPSTLLFTISEFSVPTCKLINHDQGFSVDSYHAQSFYCPFSSLTHFVPLLYLFLFQNYSHKVGWTYTSGEMCHTDNSSYRWWKEVLIHFDLTPLCHSSGTTLEISPVNGTSSRPSESETRLEHFPAKAQSTPYR